ncbi:MAG: DUF3298 and DUF4163 domain-containing protein [Treponema sp.]|nr:DUF3298 and DUF4163 domain-containing protein [Treponema sp.]
MNIAKMRFILVFSLAALVSCASSQDLNDRTGSDSFFFTKYTQVIPAFESRPVPDAQMDISLTLVAAREAKLSKLICFLLYDGMSAKQYAEQIFSDYKKEFREYADDVGEEQVRSWSYEEEHAVEVCGSYAVVSKNFYVYTGGAHGGYGTTHYVIDMNAPDRLTLNDIIDKAGFAKLKPFVDRELRLYSQEVTGEPLPPNLPLWEGIYIEADFELDDFYPTEIGLAFFWNVYEITPYAAGPVNVTVSWIELDGILNTKGRELARAFKK